MKCQVCGENEARYVDSVARLTCALCPLKEGRDSVRISDVPRLMQYAREAAQLLGQDYLWDYKVQTANALQEILGKDLSDDSQ